MLVRLLFGVGLTDSPQQEVRDLLPDLVGSADYRLFRRRPRYPRTIRAARRYGRPQVLPPPARRDGYVRPRVPPSALVRPPTPVLLPSTNPGARHRAEMYVPPPQRHTADLTPHAGAATCTSPLPPAAIPHH